MLPNPLIAEYERRNKRNTITCLLQPVSNANLKWRDLPSVKRHAYCEKLSKLQEMSFRVPRVANWRLFDGYGFEDTLREMMKLEYIYEGDGDIFVDYSWERALLIDNEIYLEWVLVFFSTFYFDKDVNRNNLMMEKCIWFRLCGHEHILTLLEFAIMLGLFTEDEVKHRLFEGYFGRLEVDDKQFDHKDYWTRVGKPTLTNHKEVLVKEPLMRIVHKVIVGSLVHRVASRERCQKQDLWMMSALEESRGVNLAWIIADHLYKHAPGSKENSVICAGHYVTKITCFLIYCVDDEIKKCLEPIDCEYWISKMLTNELDVENTCLKKETEMPNQAEKGSSEPRQEHGGLNSSWGDWNASLSRIERENVWRDSMLIRNNYMLEHSMPILHHLADQGNFAYPTYEPPNVPLYPLEVDDKQFDHKDYWTRVGKPTLTNHKEVLVKEPLMRIVHKVIVGSLVHRVASRERCQKQDLWMMSALKESRGVNLAWIIADHLYKHAPGTKKNSVICAGHYVTKITCFLVYCMDDEIKKCSEPIDYEYWISKMLADELDVENTCLKKETKMPTQAEEGSSEPRQEHRGLNSIGGLSKGDGFNDDDDDMDE
ncbi:hypothetical protein Tco_1182656 [Tanacetum coccineum]